MKETKVYVDELPKSCVGCKHFAEHRRQCNLELCIEWNEVKFKYDGCPLIDIKTHDRELVKEVLERVKLKFSDTRSHNWGIEQIELYEFLDQIQKEAENE